MSEPEVASKVYESPPNRALVDLVLRNRPRSGPGSGGGWLLDLGCGTGSNLRAFDEAGYRTVGLTISVGEARTVRKDDLAVVVGDAALRLPFVDGAFDVVVASHVLEHLVDPWGCLREVRRVLSPSGRLYVALPNVAFFRVRAQLLAGRFRYTEAGLLDRTHLRFFDLHSARELLREGGYEIVGEYYDGWIPAGPVRKLARAVVSRVEQRMLDLWPNLFGYQFVFEAVRLS